MTILFSFHDLSKMSSFYNYFVLIFQFDENVLILFRMATASRTISFYVFYEKEHSSDFMTFPSEPKNDEQKIFEGYLFIVAVQNSVVMHVSLKIQILSPKIMNKKIILK